ncbi:Uncharacterised protein [Serratia fonticola]|uniref:Uncharacterized protein n=1 Tax=Serratia fonticola TaxID=47917 RepID=A0A4U9TP93_SERFO|nr:Uncharacterised protein [Serratia fonticola]
MSDIQDKKHFVELKNVAKRFGNNTVIEKPEPGDSPVGIW